MVIRRATAYHFCIFFNAVMFSSLDNFALFIPFFFFFAHLCIWMELSSFIEWESGWVCLLADIYSKQWDTKWMVFDSFVQHCFVSIIKVAWDHNTLVRKKHLRFSLQHSLRSFPYFVSLSTCCTVFPISVAIDLLCMVVLFGQFFVFFLYRKAKMICLIDWSESTQSNVFSAWNKIFS